MDKDTKQNNDRTWCFWSKNDDLFDDITFKIWPRIQFADEHINESFDIAPYKYKMIRGIDFYNHVLNFLKSCDHTDFVTTSIQSVTEEEDAVRVLTGAGEYTAPWVFKSYYENLDFSNSNFVWQHLKGWIIKTEVDQFDEG